MKKYLIAALKIAASLLILAALFWFAFGNNLAAFFKMLAAPKRWDMLVAAWVTVLAAVLITFVRWQYLVRAVDIPLSLRSTLRIGFLGYLFNLAPFGIVGGDIFKSYLLAHEWPGNRAKSLASVFVDRIIGLEVLFLVATLGLFAGGLRSDPAPATHTVCVAVLSVTVVSTLGLACCMVPGFLSGRGLKSLEQVPKVGHAVHSLLESLRTYRSNIGVLVASTLETVPVHLLLALSLFFLARGLQFDRLTPLDFIAIYAVSGILLVIPLPAGPTEGALSFMYATACVLAAGGVGLNKTDLQEGLMIALAKKVIELSLAMIGMAFWYFGDRKEVRDVIAESNE